MPHFRKLAPDKPVTASAALKEGMPGPGRSNCYGALASLMYFAGVAFDKKLFKEELKNLKKPKPRVIPTDEEIEAYWAKASKRKDYQFAVGLYGAFGIRTAELFYAHTTPLMDGESYIIIREGAKTNTERKAYTLHDRWIDQFNLRQPNPFKPRPDCSNSQLTKRARLWFASNGICPSYNFRHAYTLRCPRLGLDPVPVAKSMGQDVLVALKDYSRWVSERDVADLFEKASTEYR